MKQFKSVRDIPKMRDFFEKMEDEEHERALYKTQKVALATLLATYLFYCFFGYLIPDFKLSSIWLITTDITASVMQYWYVIAWGVFLALVTGISRRSRKVVRNVFTGTVAGIWEEIGYRGLFIFTGILTIIISNFCFKWALLILAILAVVLCIIFILNSDGGHILKLIILVGIAVPICYKIVNSNFGHNPIYWFYEHIMFSIWHYVSFGFLDSIIYNKHYSFLFITAAMSANVTFRDGHKYQGLFGWLNSWMIGYVLLHAMMNHGIVVAIIIHSLYNFSISVIGYARYRYEQHDLWMKKPPFLRGLRQFIQKNRRSLLCFLISV